MKRKDPSQDLYKRRRDIVPTLLRLSLSAVNSELSRSLAVMLAAKDLSSIVNLQIDPKGYTCVDEFRLDYFLSEAFSKYPHWGLEVDRKAVALLKFKEMEAHCSITNARLNSPRTWSFETTSVIEIARRKIERLLGPVNWDEVALGMRHGPGGTTRLKRKNADVYYKFSGVPETTHNNLALSVAVLDSVKSWGGVIGRTGLDRVSVVAGSQVITVPKNAKTDRIIAKEPCMNVFVQKGFGNIIRRRLKKVTVNLDDQTLNRRLAYEGSLDGSLSTLDLSSASDTVSKEIVRLLLPPDWYEALCLCRSEKGILPCGTEVLFRKFSSMGNGFTFELESLIFWALCSAARQYYGETDRRMAIFGDDIIVPSGLTPKVVSLLEFAGFIVNTKKSHTDGPFRESCGKHFFKGVDVTPVYFRDRVNTYPRYIWCCNQLKRWSRLPTWGLRSDLKALYDESRGCLKGYWARPRIPDGMGDGALIGDFDEISPQKAPRGWSGYSVSYFSERLTTFLPDESPILVKSLYQLELSWKEIRRTYQISEMEGLQDDSYLSVPTENRRYHMARGVAWQWSDFGPWQD